MLVADIFNMLFYFVFFTFIITAFLLSPDLLTNMNCEVVMDTVVIDLLFMSQTIQWKFSLPNAHLLPAAYPAAAAAAEKAGALGEVPSHHHHLWKYDRKTN